MIFTVRTSLGQEGMVIELLASKAKKETLNVYSAAVLPGMKGYILIEADDQFTVTRAIQQIPNIKSKGVIAGEVKIEELATLFEAKTLMQSIQTGQKVELIAGPFKGEKARVLRVNPTKEEVTVELLEATVKIPITIKAEHIRVMKE